VAPVTGLHQNTRIAAHSARAPGIRHGARLAVSPSSARHPSRRSSFCDSSRPRLGPVGTDADPAVGR